MHIRWRGLELPSQVRCDQTSLTTTYGRFVAEPFERGFGVTVGNSLRRILLSSLEGSAVTQLRIQGAQHARGGDDPTLQPVLAGEIKKQKGHHDR